MGLNPSGQYQQVISRKIQEELGLFFLKVDTDFGQINLPQIFFFLLQSGFKRTVEVYMVKMGKGN